MGTNVLLYHVDDEDDIKEMKRIKKRDSELETLMAVV